MTGAGPLTAPPHERRASVPRGWLGAWYGTWPLLAVAGMLYDLSGWRDGFFWTFLVAALARAGYWSVRRRRNRVEVAGTQVRVVIRGKVIHFEASEVRKLVWYYGIWTLTLDPGEHVTELHVTLSDGRELSVDLWLPRKWEQREAFQRLADALPPIEWTVRWPYSVLPKRDQVWNRAQGRVPR